MQHLCQSSLVKQYKMNKVVAFFDVDETLINMKSMFSFLSHMYEALGENKSQGIDDYNKAMIKIKNMAKTQPRSAVNKFYYELYKGLEKEWVQSIAYEWFNQLDKSQGFTIEPVEHALKQHLLKKHEVVFVSGSSNEILKPIAEYFAADATLGANLETQNGVFTGNLIAPQTIGKGKATAIEHYLALHSLDANQCYAYGDDISDQFMLEAVGMPNIVAGHTQLEQWASENSYPIIRH